MAKLYGGAQYALNTSEMSPLFVENLYLKGSVVLRTSSLIRVEIQPGTFTDFVGSFQFTQSGDLYGGYFTGLTHVSAGATAFKIVGSKVGAFTFLDATTKLGIDALDLFLASPDRIIQMKGGNKADTLVADPTNRSYNYVFDGKAGADLMRGLDGNDKYIVDRAADRVIDWGGISTDTVYAKVSYALRNEAGNIEVLKAITATATTALNLSGNFRDNTIIGNNGRNYLRGNDGNDKLLGLEGNDVLIGGNGNDQLRGGAGADVFVFESALGPTNLDSIGDYRVGEDSIRLENAIFTALIDTGRLDPSAFVAGPQASTPDQHIIWDQANGKLYYDADGMGGEEQVLFAWLGGAPNLSYADFYVV